MSARRKNYKGIATFAILPVFAVFLFALNQLNNWGATTPQPTRQNESAQAQSAPATNEPTATATPDWTQATVNAVKIEAAEIERQVGQAKLTQVAAESDLHRELVAQQYRDSVAAATAQYIPTQTAIAAAQANDAAQFAIELVKAQKEADAEYWSQMAQGVFIPLFCFGALAIVGLLVVAGLFPSLRKIVESAADEATQRDDVPETVQTTTLQPVVEVHTQSGSIIRNKLDVTVLSVLPVFAGIVGELDHEQVKLTDAEWAGEEKHGITKPRWYIFRNWLLDKGFAAWKSGETSLGAELTVRGWELVDRVNDVGLPSPSELGIES